MAKGHGGKRAGSGRKTKLTPETSETILRAVRMGAYIETACAAAGVDAGTMRDWLKRGAAEESGIYHDFNEGYRRAEADAELLDLALVSRAAASDWKAAAWKLARRYPERYGDRIAATVEHGGLQLVVTRETAIQVIEATREGER